MERKLRLLLIEDDPLECQEITRCINEYEDILLIGTTNNIVKALSLTIDGIPDAIILDLELHKGGGNGLDFLRELRNLDLPITPFILITTHNTSSFTYDIARDFGADFILSKHQEDYSAKNVVDFMYSLKKTLHNKARTNGVGLNYNNHLTTEQVSRKLNQLIVTELNNVGISPKSLGFKYFIDAITLSIESIESDFKNELSKKYRKTTQSIERAMQNSISVAWKTSNIDDLSKFYTARVNPKSGAPTIMEFVHYYARKLVNYN